MICKQCLQDKSKLKAERRQPKKGKRQAGHVNGHYYRDEQGRMWQGNTCPECFYPKGKRYYKEVENEANMHPDLFFDPDPLTFRHCRKCDGNLPTSRYFYHLECAPQGVSDLLEGLGGWT